MKTNETERRIRRGLLHLAARNAPTTAEIREGLSAMQPNTLVDTAAFDRASGDGKGPRHREAAPVLVAAGIVAAMLVGLSLALGSNGSPEPRNQLPSSPPIGDQPSGPGMESPTDVGRGRAVVSVPGDWTRGDVRCGEPLSNTVIFESTGSRSCYTRPTKFNTLTIGSAATHRLTATAIRTTVGGVDVLTSPARKQDGFTVIETLVPSEDAWFLVRCREANLAHEIAGSLRVLPESQTTMPDIYLGATGGQPGFSAVPSPVEVKRRLEQAGLTLRARYVGNASPDHWSSLRADVEPGTILPAGAEVTLTYSVGTKGP